MNHEQWHEHKRSNRIQSVLLLLGMGLIFGLMGWALGGWGGFWLALIVGGAFVVFSPRLSPEMMLKLYRAQPLRAEQAPRLMQLVNIISQRAELPVPPKLYYVPSSMVNAFALGTPEQSAVALTDGIVRNLSLRELTGVLAHEISHIRHKDTWLMGVADLFSRLTGTLSMVGQFLLILNLPLMFLSEGGGFNWIGILLLIFAPTLSSLMQLALSRTREYDADLGAVDLTHDPIGLASALKKLQGFHKRWFDQILLPGRRVPDPSMLRTHPPTEERIARLLNLRETDTPLLAEQTSTHRQRDFTYAPVVRRPPQWHMMGLWY